MAQLSISLLGTLRIRLDGAPVTAIESDKGRALLAYLLVEDGQPHRRETLATLLWPETTEKKARQNLRRALYNLRQALAQNDGETPFFEASTKTIEFNGESDHWLDVRAFISHLHLCQAHQHRRLDGCPTCIERLGEAVDLYRGDFLAGLTLSDSEPFEEWRLFKQQELYSQVVGALTDLATYYARRRDYVTATRYLRRQIELEPWREEAHRQLMQVLALKGERSAALQQYELCSQILAEELGVRPAAETRDLYKRIEAEEIQAAPIEAQNPYKGLQAFTQEDAADFYGREAFVEHLADAVQYQGRVVVIGPSGSGKSSVIQAGLLPRLSESPTPGGRLPDSGQGQGTEDQWIALTVRPGSRPFHRLAEALIPFLEPPLSADQEALEVRVRSLAQQLRDGEERLEDLLERILHEVGYQDRSPCCLLLVVDQLEEIYTQCEDADTRQTFLDAVLQSVDSDPERALSPPLTLLLSLRADFIAQSLSHRPLADAIQMGALVLGPMIQEELQRAIEEPARGWGVIFEPGLVERLLHDAGNEPGNLPLLQFTLTQLWDQQTGKQLTHEAYGLIGGLDGALSRYADSVYQQLSAEEQQGAQRVFTQLVRPGEGTEDIRCVATRTELGRDWDLVRKLADARLLVTDSDPGEQETAELVHEALIRNWERLRLWMEADRAFHTWHQRLRAAIKQWEASGRDTGALLHGVPLAEAEQWATRRPTDLRVQERDFIAAGATQRDEMLAEAQQRREQELARAQALADAEHQRAEAEHRRAEAEGSRADVQTRARRRLRWLAGGYALMLILVVGAGFWARIQLQTASRTAAVAQSLNLAASARLALDRDDTDLALALATEANRIPDPLPQLQLMLAEAAYAPGTRRALIGHDGPVQDVAVSPDGRLAISASADQSLMVWDVATGENLQRLEGHTDTVNGVAIGPDGRTALSGAADHSLILWDLASGELLRTFTGHKDAVHDVTISPDGKTALSAAADSTLILWDLATGAAIRRFSDHTGPVLSVAISPDGLTALSGSADRSVILWDLAAGEIIHRLSGQTDTLPAGLHDPVGHVDVASAVAFSIDGQKAISSSQDGTTMIWDLQTGEPAGFLQAPEGGLSSMAVSPDGHSMLLGMLDNRIVLLDLTGGDRALQLRGHRGRVLAVAFGPDGRHALSGSSDGTVRVWDLQSGAQVRSLHDESFGTGVDISPDGRTGLTAATDGSIWLWDYETGAMDHHLGENPQALVAGARFTPDGNAIVSGEGTASGTPAENTVRLWSVATGEEIWRFEGHTDKVWDVAAGPEGRYAVSGSQDGTLRLWDLGKGTGDILADVAPQAVRSVVFSPDGLAVLVGLERGTSTVPDTGLRLVDRPTGEEIRRFEGHTETVSDLAFSPDGQFALSASKDLRVILWDVATGLAVYELATFSHEIVPVAFSPDGQLAAGGSTNGEILVWEVDSGALLRTLASHDASVKGIVFAPDGRTLLSVAGDDTVREWRIDASQEALQAWIETSRYIPELTCEERVQYGVEPLCDEAGTPGTATP